MSLPRGIRGVVSKLPGVLTGWLVQIILVLCARDPRRPLKGKSAAIDKLIARRPWGGQKLGSERGWRKEKIDESQRNAVGVFLEVCLR